MVSRAVLGVRGLLAVLVTAGCFDVHSVDTGPLIIDDFQDGNVYPSDPAFQRWACGKFPVPADDQYRCTNDDKTGYQSDHSLYLEATIEVMLDGILQQGGAFLETVATTTKDFGRFSRLVFAAKLESDNLPPLSKPTLDVRINCNSARLKPGEQADSRYVSFRTELPGSDWQVLKAELGDFTVPPELNGKLLERTPGCLRFADTLRFEVGADLPFGQSGHLTLHIDDVELE